MLRPFGENLWLTDGPTTSVGGFVYPTRAAILRLADGSLFIWSPVRLTEALRSAVGTLGEVRHLVAPNSLHHLYLDDWRRAWPEAILYAPPGLRRKRRDLVFDADLDDTPPPAWAGQIDQVRVVGNLITTEVVFFHRASRTVLFTDLIQHFGPEAFSGWRRIVAGLDLMTASEPEVPRKFRVAFMDRRRARAALARILAWPADRVVMAHADPLETGGQDFIARTFRWLRIG